MATLKSPPSKNDRRGLCNEQIVLVVYAPFGTDEELSTYPDGTSVDLAQHPLVVNLKQVAAQGVSVCALIDRVDCDTVLLEIPGGKPRLARLYDCWKQDMASPRALAGLLRRAHECHRGRTIVLALEGHGAGYLPEIDRRQITHSTLTNPAGGPVKWQIDPAPSPKPGDPPLAMGAPILPMGAPILAMGAPILPMGAPILPSNHLPLSTWGLGEALRLARDEGQVSRPAIVHLNNCFNQSTELLHTLMPHADYATGYGNYNFFTAGQTYPTLFQALRGTTYSVEQLARGFALGNGALLQTKGNHPSVGGTIRLGRMEGVAKALDLLAQKLIDALVNAGSGRGALTDLIQKALVGSQVYDTDGTFTLEMPDQMVDLMSFAHGLQAPTLGFGPGITDAARTLETALAKVKQYGANDRPWLIEPPTTVRWDFSAKELAMNILFPDPDRRGLFDWRSIFYLNKKAETDTPRVQPHVIDLLKQTHWIDFIVEYHKETVFTGLLPALIPSFPVFNAGYEPKDGGQDGPNGPLGKGGPTGPTGGPGKRG